MAIRTSADVLPIQRAVACASPRSWHDALVVASEPGILRVALLDGRELELGTLADLAAGEPVAVHEVAELVAVGDEWFSARIFS